MRTLKQHIKLNKSQYKILLDYSHYSNNLYNYALYVVNEYFKQTGKYIGYIELEKQIKSNDNYRLLPAQSAQQIIRLVDQNFRSFFVLLKKKGEGKYDDKINIPKYKKKGSCFNVIYTFQNSKLLYNSILLHGSHDYKKEISKDKLEIPFTYKIEGNIKQIMFKPVQNGKSFRMYINYEENKKEKYDVNEKKYLGIDLGINNLATCFDASSGHSFIMNGKSLKSLNRWYNKKVAEKKSILKRVNNKEWSNYLNSISIYRNNYIDNYFNQYVSRIIKYCIENKIGNIVIGYNETWKNGMNLGKANNQKFYSIPYLKFKIKLENKCEESGIKFIFTEESYTSKCSFLDNEKIEKRKTYVGKRIKRGLFKSAEGKLLNADVNGAANIVRKVFDDVVYDQSILGLMFNPVRYNV